MKSLTALLIALAGTLLGYAQTLKPDLNFAKKGWTKTNFLNSNDLSESSKGVVLLPDGSQVVLVTVGSSGGTESKTFLFHHFADGTLDTSFGNNGVSEVSEIREPFFAVQKTGQIIVAGQSADRTIGSFFMAERFNSNGFKDTAFGEKGKAIIDITNDYESVNTLSIQQDGKILIAGYGSEYVNGSYIGFSFIIVRLNKDGTIDKSFGSEGIVKQNDFGKSCQIRTMVLQPDNKIVVAGIVTTFEEGDTRGIIARYNDDGSIDKTFNDSGFHIISVGKDYDEITSIGIASDGKIIAACRFIYNEQFSSFGILRYNTDGKLDKSFGENGVIKYETSDYKTINDLLISRDDKIVLAGHQSSFTTSNGFILKLNKDGSEDNFFGENGKIMVDIFQRSESPNSLSELPLGKILVSGHCNCQNNGDYFTAVYDNYGELDKSYSADGQLKGFYPSDVTAFEKILVQKNGMLVVAGRSAPEGLPTSLVMARYDVHGKLDESFAIGGKFINKTEADTGTYATTLAEQPDGKIIVGGGIYSSGKELENFLLMRLNKDGSIDSTFGINGIVSTDFEGRSDKINAITLQADGKIVAAGTSYTGYYENQDMALARYHPDGKLDLNFSGDGKVLTHFRNEEDAKSILIQSDGKIVVAGFSSRPDIEINVDYAVARYNTDGTLDKSFSGDGKATIDFEASFDIGVSVVQQPDGKLVIAGYASMDQDNSGNGFGLVRLMPSGILDKYFGKDGISYVNLGADRNNYLTGLHLQKNGKFLLTGYSYYFLENFHLISVAQLDEKGLVDSSFSDSGRFSSSTTGSNTQIFSSELAGGKLYLAGSGADLQYITYGLVVAYDLCTTKIYFRDKDSDGWGGADETTTACAVPSGYTAKSGDCNDSNSKINPAAKEICDGKDNNCDGIIDEGCNNTVSSYTLLNSKTDTDIQPLQDGDEIDLATIPGNAINIKANTKAAVGSVVMKLTGAHSKVQTESIAPYALFGNTGNNYKNWTPQPGNYTLSAIPYSKAKGKGEAGAAKEVSFKIVYNLTLSHFTFVNSKTNKDISTLQDGAVIDLAQTPYVNIRANTDKGFTESVRFDVNGNQYLKVQSHLPYALATDNKGDYLNWKVRPGTYTITATPFGQDGGKGLSGTPLSITVTVIDSKNTALNKIEVATVEPKQQLAEKKSLHLVTYPNPAVNNAVAEFSLPQTTQVKLILADASGKKVQEIFSGIAEANIVHRKNINTSVLSPGLYFCWLVTKEGAIKVNKVIKQ